MRDKNLFHKNPRFYLGLLLTVLEGLLSGSNYIVLYDGAENAVRRVR